MTTNENVSRPTPIQILAAQITLKADKRLKRTTPADIRAIARAPRTRASGSRRSA